MHGKKSVPFEIPEISHGFQEGKGLMRVSPEGIELEFEVTDAIVGIMSSGIKHVTLNYSDLDSIEYRKGWFSDRILLEATSMKALEELPGSDVASCKLKVKRKHRDDAQSLVSIARLNLSEYKLDQLGDGS